MTTPNPAPRVVLNVTVTTDHPEPIPSWLRKCRDWTAGIHMVLAALMLVAGVLSFFTTADVPAREYAANVRTPIWVSVTMLVIVLDFVWISFLLFEDRHPRSQTRTIVPTRKPKGPADA